MIEDLVVEVHRLFERQAIRHAFGGALALNYYAPPRGTIDLDVNVGVDAQRLDGLVATLGALGFTPSVPPSRWLPAAGVRVTRGFDTLDLFASFDDYHDLVLDRAVRRPFRQGSHVVEIPVLTAEDLVVFKASFGRAKDWVDIEAMLAAGTPVDPCYVEAHLVGLRGSSMYPRTARLRLMLSQREARSEEPPGPGP